MKLGIALLCLFAIGPMAALADPTVPQVRNAFGQTVPAPIVQEAVTLAAGNAPAAASAVLGGSYVFAQACASYGSVALQVRGPDGATFVTIGTYTTPDTTGGRTVQLGSGAIVQLALTGTTGCNATLSRIP